MIEHGRNALGEGAVMFEPVTIGFPSRDRIGEKEYPGATIGRNAVLRSGTIIYCDVTIGENFQTGHNVLIREKTTIGDRVAIGTAAVIEGVMIKRRDSTYVAGRPRGPWFRSPIHI